MSPPRHKQTARLRSRSEVVVAVLVGVGIVAATVLLIWLMRPKSSDGTPGTGGLFTRQPRVILLLVLALIVMISVTAYLRFGRRRPKKMNSGTSTTISAVVIVALAIVAGILWPGGLIRHWPPQPKAVSSDNTTPATPAPTTPPTTAAKSNTTRPTTATSIKK